mmetsp:Transcript_3341/g.10183  ORF Transcript_3341/g.10183 Transcript_3341/m.10183 type:complete len:109 (+) Transcript_3341:198-524(+)|eukprot:CAMPEP_0198732160 /NCGR_PEP_ID=MMETSP1475-20131203/34202_1 /TAXON_ID= ORGANISM="Unidentified sp., Strain CCMP1999" /NCGR_SAMPLE_ID=MMETSP1475 /ASSEMBLY_ACC=CAM_ASM_001111 /LENGTH=108 /DNA_ID=CAMNT_0044495223 /DNA_START=115 /DNA_END=441 /DNA_ORIENTATION=-
MAFVAGSQFLGVSKVQTSSVCKRSTAVRRSQTVCMVQKKPDGEFDFEDITTDTKEKQGWTWWSETWNGRLAMMGFVIAVATEQINPAHPTIIDQIKTLLHFTSTGQTV